MRDPSTKRGCRIARTVYDANRQKCSPAPVSRVSAPISELLLPYAEYGASERRLRKPDASVKLYRSVVCMLVVLVSRSPA